MNKFILKLLKDIVLNGIGSSGFLYNKLRPFVIRMAGVSIESPRTTAIFSGCRFDGTDVSIGTGTLINVGCFFQADAPIIIGRHCSIAMQVMFSSPSHEIGGPNKRAGKNFAKPITVEDGCWIGTRAIILPGVTIGKGCVIAAGAVVIRDCEPNGLYAGVPAKRLRDLAETDAAPS